MIESQRAFFTESIPVSDLCILGMWIQSNRQSSHTLSTLRTTTLQVSRMIARVTTRRHGMREEDTLKLVRSLVVSRVTYSLPYQRLTKAEVDQIDAMLRRAYKAALKLPLGTSNNKLLSLGVHNTFEELREAQLATQLSRLAQTSTGRDLLRRLGHMGLLRDVAKQQPIPSNLQATYKVAPIPRNMDPQLHHGRREARVEALRKQHLNKTSARYVDAALYTGNRNKAVATVVDHRLREITSASIRCSSITEAEETAIALAIATGNHQRRSLDILTDSQAACRNFLNGRVGQAAISILRGAPDPNDTLDTRNPIIRHRIIWTPGHMGLEGNQEADRVARGYTTDRAPHDPASEEPIPVPCEYAAILNHYKGLRRIYSLPHKKLTKEEATSWRLIQTGTYPNLHFLNKMHPTEYPARCPWCSEKPTLIHITWTCRAIPGLPPIDQASVERWEELLASDNLDDQISLIDRARRAATACGVLD